MTVVSTLPPSPHEETDNAIILKIFSSIGRCRFLDEKHFDACTALAGSGPAFACIFLEAMADGGVMMGLPRTEALELAAQSECNALKYRWICLSSVTEIGDARSIPGCSPNGIAGERSPGADQRCSQQYVLS